MDNKNINIIMFLLKPRYICNFKTYGEGDKRVITDLKIIGKIEK